MPQRVTLLAHAGAPHEHGGPHGPTPHAALVFLHIEVIERIRQIAQPVTGKEGNLVHPVPKPLRHRFRLHSRPFSRADDLLIRQGGQPVDRLLP